MRPYSSPAATPPCMQQLPTMKAGFNVAYYFYFYAPPGTHHPVRSGQSGNQTMNGEDIKHNTLLEVSTYNGPQDAEGNPQIKSPEAGRTGGLSTHFYYPVHAWPVQGPRVLQLSNTIHTDAQDQACPFSSFKSLVRRCCALWI